MSFYFLFGQSSLADKMILFESKGFTGSVVLGFYISMQVFHHELVDTDQVSL